MRPVAMKQGPAVLLWLVGISSSLSAEEDGLRLLHLVFRHGERTPADTYPTDPYLNNTFYPYGWGELTNKGKNQQYELGLWLRKRYDSFLGKRYSEDLLEAWTTDVSRTKKSAALMLAGLFPPVGDQIWNKDLLWQPILTKHQKLSEDKLLLVRGCPRYSEAVEEVKADQFAKEIAKHQELYDFLSRHVGRTVANPDDVMDVYNTLLAEERFGLKLPEWTNKIYPDQMAEVTAFSFLVNSHTDELKRLKGGPLLKKILKDSENNIEEKAPKRKLFIYAGHDSTVANFMQALKVWEPQIPTYNILAIIELHKFEGKYGLKIFLRNSTVHEPYLLKIPGCEEFCPMENVIRLTSSVIPDDLEKECAAKNNDYSVSSDRAP